MFSSSIETAIAKTSVDINGVYMRFTQAIDTLVRLCRPLAFHNEASPFELSIVGSCFLVKQVQKLVLVTTRHQLGKGENARAPNEACILLQTDGKLSALTCSEYGIPKFAGDTDSKIREDIIFLRFASGTHNLIPHFFDIFRSRTMFEVPEERIILYFAIGFPTEFTDLEGNFDDPDALSFDGYVSRFVKIYLETDHKISMPAHIEFQVQSKQPITLENFDGLSGSPVFFIYQDDAQQCHIGYAGMIRLGGNNIFHIYDGAEIKKMIDRL